MESPDAMAGQGGWISLIFAEKWRFSWRGQEKKHAPSRPVRVENRMRAGGAFGTGSDSKAGSRKLFPSPAKALGFQQIAWPGQGLYHCGQSEGKADVDYDFANDEAIRENRGLARH